MSLNGLSAIYVPPEDGFFERPANLYEKPGLSLMDSAASIGGTESLESLISLAKLAAGMSFDMVVFGGDVFLKDGSTLDILCIAKNGPSAPAAVANAQVNHHMRVSFTNRYTLQRIVQEGHFPSWYLAVLSSEFLHLRVGKEIPLGKLRMAFRTDPVGSLIELIAHDIHTQFSHPPAQGGVHIAEDLIEEVSARRDAKEMMAAAERMAHRRKLTSRCKPRVLSKISRMINRNKIAQKRYVRRSGR